MNTPYKKRTEDLGSQRREQFFAPSPDPVKVEFGARSDRGKVRENNEDQWLVVRRLRTRDVLATSLPEGWLPSQNEHTYSLAVADGMGGAEFGEIASMFALRSAFELGFEEIKWPMRLTDDEALEILEKIDAYGDLIHRKMREEIEQNPRLEGMGTTLTVAVTVGLDAFIGHVGDSRAYLFRNGTLTQLTRDHTLAQRFIDAGVFSASSLEARMLSHVLTNCLGASADPVQVDVAHHRLEYGSRLLLCTDGLSDAVKGEQIAETLESNPTPATACNVLMDMALDRGGQDNITVVVASYEKPD
jgi:protein phosphatase